MFIESEGIMNGLIFRINGALLIIIGLVGTFYQTHAYGNHTIPQTTPEAISDLICVLFVLTGLVLQTIGSALPNKE
jgi:hypothetical protein